MTSSKSGKLDRRAMLRTALAATAGVGLASALPDTALAQPNHQIQPNTLGMHLFTMRRSLAINTPATYATLAAIGYRTVGVSGRNGFTAQQLRTVADDVGLKTVLEHVGFDRITNNWQGAIDDVLTMGGKWIVVPSLPGSLHSADGYRQVAEIFNEAGRQARQSGLKLLYHNHSTDFTVDNGQVLYDILVAETDPEFVGFELDLYWCVAGGQDPIKYLAGSPGRFPALHVKDMAPDGSFEDVGAGILDFPAMFQHAVTGGVEQFLVERDDPVEDFITAQVSYDYLSRVKF